MTRWVMTQKTQAKSLKVLSNLHNKMGPMNSSMIRNLDVDGGCPEDFSQKAVVSLPYPL